MPTYYDYFENAYNQALRNRQLGQLEAYRQQEIANARARLDEQIRAHNANEIIRQAGQAATVQRYLNAQGQQQAQDAEANRIANTINPPAATAVTTDPSDPNSVAWTNRANAMRSQYFAAHPNEQPGPPVPYTGGQKRFASIEKYLAPQKPAAAKAVPGAAVAKTADANAQAVAASAFGPYGLGYADVSNPQTKFEYMSGNDDKAVGQDNGPYVRVTPPGKQPVYVDSKAYGKWVGARTKSLARQDQMTPSSTSADPSSYLASPPRSTGNTAPNDQAAQAKAWAEANPDDPRAKQILSIIQ